MIQRTVIGAILFCLASLSFADEIRPGYLELKENSRNVFSMLWKIPAKGDKALNLQVQLPADCIDIITPHSRFIDAAYILRRVVACEEGLVGQSISIEGLNSTRTNVLLRLELLDGTSQSVQLTPTQSAYRVPAVASPLQIVSTYTMLGAEHILLGVDHLLFVFALLLIVSSTRRLIMTITSFTLAHSITLGAATLGFVHIPQQPVEAVIALSILFLAVELVHGKQGRKGVAVSWPWVVAFIFGLLHGLGFAGALAEVGLPQQAIPLALIFFNIGVELGQLLFVVVVLSLGWALRQMKQPVLLARAESAAIYSIGGLSSFWLFERISVF